MATYVLKTMSIASVNPTTGEVVRRFEADGELEIEAKVQRAADAFRRWRLTSLETRATLLGGAGALMATDSEVLARLATDEMGKTLRAARDEVAKCAATLIHYADHAAAWLAPEPVAGPDQAVWFEPLGVVLAVMPWNFPFWQVIRFAAPAIAAGNVALLKHASNVPRCALALADLFRRAGAEEGVFQTLLVGSERVERLIADPRVAAVTLTGSEGAGRATGTAAGAHLKKTVLELGGSDPFIVLSSADVERAAKVAAQARTINNGESCIAAKRFIVVNSLYDGFAALLVEQMRALRVGDPRDERTDVGPLALPSIRDEVARQVRDSVAAGARLLLGGEPAEGERPRGEGTFYPATVLGDTPPGAPAAREEVFGPVAALFRVADADAALALANASPYGLGASVWTRDRDEARRFARDLEVGSVFVNEMVASDPRFPFGGVKRSGHGRELAAFGLREFVNVKTVRMTL